MVVSLCLRPKDTDIFIRIIELENGKLWDELRRESSLPKQLLRFRLKDRGALVSLEGIDNLRGLNVIVPCSRQNPFDSTIPRHNGSRHLPLRLTREVRIRDEFEVTLVARYMICDVHLSALVDPKLSDDDVVDGRRYFSPSVMVACTHHKLPFLLQRHKYLYQLITKILN